MAELQDSSKNSAYLTTTMNQCISEEITKHSQKKKLRSKSPESEEDLVSEPMLQGLLQVLFTKWSSEISEMLENVNNNAEDKLKLQRDEFKAIERGLIDEIDDLRNQIDNVGQYTRRDNIKIVGVPKTDEDEDINKIVIEIAKHNGVDLEPQDISIAHRINTRDDKEDTTGTNARGKPPKVPSIICRLVNRTKKAELFDIRRQIREKQVGGGKEY